MVELLSIELKRGSWLSLARVNGKGKYTFVFFLSQLLTLSQSRYIVFFIFLYIVLYILIYKQLCRLAEAFGFVGGKDALKRFKDTDF